VLAIVEDQQQLPILDIAHQRFDDRSPRNLHYAEHRRDGLGDAARVRHRGQLDEQDANREVVEDVGGNLQRQAVLAEAAHPEQCHQSRRPEQRMHCRAALVVTDE